MEEAKTKWDIGILVGGAKEKVKEKVEWRDDIAHGIMKGEHLKVKYRCSRCKDLNYGRWVAGRRFLCWCCIKGKDTWVYGHKGKRR